MFPSSVIPVWWMLVFCGASWISCYLALSSDERIVSGFAAKARVTAELAVPGGVLYWLVVRWMGWGYPVHLQPRYLHFDDAAGFAFFAGLIWIAPAWFLTAWRLERVLREPFWRCSQTATRASIAMGIVLALLNTGWQVSVLIALGE
jgi:hypothetical protein